MDDIVKQAMQKWPNVPDCYGWLGLDARGDWYMRDDQAQEKGLFSSGVPGSKGVRLTHDKLIAFIGRNYAPDPHGCWYFQNGPQRVYVELETAPWIYRIQNDGAVHTHTGYVTEHQQTFVDEQGWLYLLTPLGLGLVHSQDVAVAAQHIETGGWFVQNVSRSALSQRFGFVPSPQRAHPTTPRRRI